MRIFPGVHYSMGGLWSTLTSGRTFPAVGRSECDYSIHGANRLGANSLVSCVYGGFIAAPRPIEWLRTLSATRRRFGDYDSNSSGNRKSTTR